MTEIQFLQLIKKEIADAPYGEGIAFNLTGILRIIDDRITKSEPTQGDDLETFIGQRIYEINKENTKVIGTIRVGDEAKSMEDLNDVDWNLKRLHDWVIDEKRKPAITAFTSGWVRTVAREIEYKLKADTTKTEKLREALGGLVKLKKYKEENGKDEYYEIEKLGAWHNATEALKEHG